MWASLHCPHRGTGPNGEERETPLSNRTREKDRAVARKMFEKAIKWRWVRHNPVAATDEPKGENRDPVILSQKEYDRLLTKCPHDPMLHLW
jgi:site-specific recombinase XerD